MACTSAAGKSFLDCQHFLERLGWRGRAEEWTAVVDAELDRVARVVEDSGWLP